MTSWNREIILDRGKKLSLTEKYQLSEWKEPVKMNFTTAFNASQPSPGRILLTGKQDTSLIYEMVYDPVKLKATIEVIEVTDNRLKSVWGDHLTRLVLISQDKSLKGQYNFVLKKSKKSINKRLNDKN